MSTKASNQPDGSRCNKKLEQQEGALKNLQCYYTSYTILPLPRQLAHTAQAAMMSCIVKQLSRLFECGGGANGKREMGMEREHSTLFAISRVQFPVRRVGGMTKKKKCCRNLTR